MTTAPTLDLGGRQGPPAGDLGERRLLRDRDPDRPHRRAARRRGRPPRGLDRARRRLRHRQRGDRRRPHGLRCHRDRLRPSLLDRARERAAAEGSPSTLRDGDAESLPFPTRRSTRRSRSWDRCSPPTTAAPPPSSIRVTRPAARSRSRAGRPRASSARCSRRSPRTCRRRPALLTDALGDGGAPRRASSARDVTWTHRGARSRSASSRRTRSSTASRRTTARC